LPVRAVDDYRAAMDVFALERGAAAAFRIVDAANEFIASSEPWVLARDERRADELSQTLFDVAEAIRVASILLLPIMPQSAAEILRRVGESRPARDIRLTEAQWRQEGERVIAKADALWPRSDASQRSTRVEETKNANAGQAAAGTRSQTPGTEGQTTSMAAPVTAAPAASDTRISIDDFMKVELRTAKVLTAERVPNSKKLIKLSVDVGAEQRTLVAGIAEAYEPDALVGRTVVMVFNLKTGQVDGHRIETAWCWLPARTAVSRHSSDSTRRSRPEHRVR
jgi:methionyl-tRNA synthetase